MKDFGKFTAHNESIDIGGGEMVGIIIFRDANGIDWFELAAQFPHPWYICVSDEMRIQSMESSHENSQIAGHLIGIDSDFGYTRGPGGTVYGKIWNGAAIVEPEPEAEPIPDNISRRQFFQQLAVMEIITRGDALAALQGGTIPAPLQAIIDQLPTEDHKFDAQMFVIGAQTFDRLHWLTDNVRLAMEWTLEQRDDFWIAAARL